MDTATILQLGAALFIANRVDKKVEALLTEFRESNEITFGLLRTLVGQKDLHERRIRRIEQHLNDKLQEVEETEAEEEEDVQIQGFMRVPEKEPSSNKVVASAEKRLAKRISLLP